LFDQDQTRSSYERVAQRYADELAGELANKPFDREFLDSFADRVREGRVVELGCGPGHVSAYLAGRGVSVSGLDLSPAMVEQAYRLFPQIPFEVGDMLDLPFDDGSSDALISFYSIVHFDEHQTDAAFSEMARVLVPNGVVALAFHVGSDVVHRDEWFGEPVNIDFKLHNPEVVKVQLERVGLRVESSQERDPYPPPVEAQTRRCYIIAVKQPQ
jgi:ubiquinone/menaquinone biosynthesis C-methylase UbiE